MTNRKAKNESKIYEESKEEIISRKVWF